MALYKTLRKHYWRFSMEKIKEQAAKIKEALNKVLKYLRINDEKGMVSLTNIAMILVIYKIAVTPVVSFEDITALALGVLGYQAKRVIEGLKQ